MMCLKNILKYGEESIINKMDKFIIVTTKDFIKKIGIKKGDNYVYLVKENTACVYACNSFEKAKELLQKLIDENEYYKDYEILSQKQAEQKYTNLIYNKDSGISCPCCGFPLGLVENELLKCINPSCLFNTNEIICLVNGKIDKRK